jgi:hypothetical protein
MSSLPTSLVLAAFALVGPITASANSSIITAPPPTSTADPASCEVAPTFTSIDCRLDALVAQVNAASDIGHVRAMLLRQLDNATMRKQMAEMLCAEGQIHKGRQRCTTPSGGWSISTSGCARTPAVARLARRREGYWPTRARPS